MMASAFAGIVIDTSTSVPLVWLIAAVCAVIGGVWKIATVLTRILDRLTALEKRNEVIDTRSGD